jgi:NAD(P)-dependent dehydrogenase (short-subunit alcohol dehydrogenase family)
MQQSGLYLWDINLTGAFIST